MALSKTTDSGKTWTHKRLLGSPAPYGTACRDIAVSSADPNILYVAGWEDYLIKVFRSADEADTFKDITGQLASLHGNYDCAYALWVAPDDPNSILVGSSRGIFSTTTYGQFWNSTSFTFSVLDFAYNSVEDILYAATEYDGVYFSTDRGLSWDPLNDGLDYKKMLRLALDTENNILFAGTDGGGAWKLDLNPPAETLSPDVNNNGVVDLADLTIVASRWSDYCSAPDWCQSCDLDTSGFVDSADLLILTNSWLWCRADLNSDYSVNLDDFAVLAQHYLDSCSAPDWCQNADTDFTGTVDITDLQNLIDHWQR